MSNENENTVFIKIPESLTLFIKNLFPIYSSRSICSNDPCFIDFILNRRNKFSKSYLTNAIQILLILNKYGKIRLNKLSEILNMNPGAVHNYVNELYNNGFLELERNGDRVVYIKFNENTRKAIIDFKNLLNFIQNRLEKERNDYKQIIECIDKSTLSSSF